MGGPERLQAEVVVVGGGMAGASVAFELAAAGVEVLLLEAEEQLAHHTTGRSAAAYLPAYGNEVVRGLTRASRVDFDRLADLLDLPPLLSPRPLLWVADDEARAGLDARIAEVPSLREVSVEEALALCPVLRPEAVVAAAVEDDAMDIDVMGLHGGYVRGLRAHGGRVCRSARVHALEAEGEGWRVRAGPPERAGGRAAGGRGGPGSGAGAGAGAGATVQVEARAVVDAAGAWADEVAVGAGVAPVGLAPLRRTIFTSPVPAGAVEGGIGAWPLVVDAAERWYFKPEGEQLLVSLADETPQEPGDARPQEADVALALDRVNEATTLGLRSVRAAWAGLRTFAPDRTPVAGPEPDRPGFCWLAGQGGYGIQLAPALARATAALLGHEPLPADVAAEGVTAGDLSPARFR